MEATLSNLEKLVQEQGFASLHEFAKIRLTAWLKNLLAESFMPSQKQQFEKLIEKLQPEIVLPFQDFPQNRSYTLAQEQAIEKVLAFFAYKLPDFVRYEFEQYCLQQLGLQNLLVRYYSQKYATDWQNAHTNFVNFPFDILEKEDDLARWQEALELKEQYETDLSSIYTWNHQQN